MWAQKGYFVYIMSSQRRVLYIGVTNNLVRRAFQHKTEPWKDSPANTM